MCFMTYAFKISYRKLQLILRVKFIVVEHSDISMEKGILDFKEKNIRT